MAEGPDNTQKGAPSEADTDSEALSPYPYLDAESQPDDTVELDRASHHVESFEDEEYRLCSDRGDNFDFDALLNDGARARDGNIEAEGNWTGTVLGNLRIGRLLRRDTHSDVYEVSCDTKIRVLSPLAYSDDIEARSFVTAGVDKKLARYRRRVMRRLTQRTICKHDRNGETIVIYKTDQYIAATHLSVPRY